MVARYRRYCHTRYNTFDTSFILLLCTHIITHTHTHRRPRQEDEKDPAVKNMFGRTPVWKMRGVFLTSIFNVLSQAGWKLCSSNGSGAGGE